VPIRKLVGEEYYFPNALTCLQKTHLSVKPVFPQKEEFGNTKHEQNMKGYSRLTQVAKAILRMAQCYKIVSWAWHSNLEMYRTKR
jgi:hypothetical protein